jgi:hypothetical protein
VPQKNELCRCSGGTGRDEQIEDVLIVVRALEELEVEKEEEVDADATLLLMLARRVSDRIMTLAP